MFNVSCPRISDREVHHVINVATDPIKASRVFVFHYVKRGSKGLSEIRSISMIIDQRYTLNAIDLTRAKQMSLVSSKE